MASLILEHEGHQRAAVLQGRVVIGRRSNSHIVVPDRSVSRIHAWIGRKGETYFIADSGSRVGTLINGNALHGRQTLADGDEIRIGPAIIRYQSNGTLPAGAEELDLSDRPTKSDDGIFLDCRCGAPLWAPWDFAGRMGQCRYCGQMVEMPQEQGRAPLQDPSNDTVVPGMPAPAAASRTRGVRISAAQATPRSRHPVFDAPINPPANAGPALQTEETLCGACQSPISLLEETYRCPDCGLTFHAECWVENRGCSSYGCQQVGVLDPDREQPKVVQTAESRSLAPSDSEAHHAPAHRPDAVEWDYLFLPLSLVMALLGVATFGVPSVLAGIAVLIYRLCRRRITHPRMLTASLLISIVAALAGLGLSWYWWLSVPSGTGPFKL